MRGFSSVLWRSLVQYYDIHFEKEKKHLRFQHRRFDDKVSISISYGTGMGQEGVGLKDPVHYLFTCRRDETHSKWTVNVKKILITIFRFLVCILICESGHNCIHVWKQIHILLEPFWGLRVVWTFITDSRRLPSQHSFCTSCVRRSSIPYSRSFSPGFGFVSHNILQVSIRFQEAMFLVLSCHTTNYLQKSCIRLDL